MTPLPLLAAVLVAGAVLVAVLLVVLLVRRRRTRAVPAGPRTVAELVEMRAATASPGVAAPAPSDPEPATADVPAPAEPAAAPAAEPPRAAAPAPAAVAPTAPAPPTGPVALLGDDVPWRRGALMSGASAGLAEPRPVAATPAGRVPVAAVRPAPVAARPAGSTRRAAAPDRPGPWSALRPEPAAERPVAPAPRAPVVVPVVDPPRSGSSAPAAPVAEPPAAEPRAVEPAAAEPAAAEPAAAEPAAAEPAAAEPAAAEPAAAEPAPAEPGVVEESVPEMSPAEPPAAEPAAPERPAPAPTPAPPPTPAVLRPTAEQAAADLALLRTFGAVDLASRPDRAPDVALASATRPEPEPEPGAAQPVRFRVVRRGGEPIAEAAVALLDAAGRETAAASGASGELTAPRPGRYVLVATAAGHQAGALALGVADAPVDAELLLVRSAVLRGLVTGEDGPVPGARVTLVQDGEVVETADGDGDGAYRVDGLAAGEYAVSIAAAGCEPHVELVLLPDEAEVVHDVDLAPAGVAAGWGTDGG